MRRLVLLAAALAAPAAAEASPFFIPGSLVVSVEGNGVYGAAAGSYTDNQAAPSTLFQYTPVGTASAVYAGSLVLPQTASAGNYAFSGEYGSSSEGLLHLSGNGAYLSIAGYGINAAAFNGDPGAYGTAINDPTKPTALGQSGSLTGQGYTAVPRVVALIDAAGNVDTTTALYNIYNGNNPRSAYTVDGTGIYVSGQGISGDTTDGVFYAAKGSTSAAMVTGKDTSKNAATQDTRDVQVVNGQLTVSVDSTSGKGNNRDFIGTLGTAGAPPTSVANGAAGPAMLPGYGSSDGHGTYAITAATTNGINADGQTINLSPEEFFFANATTLYVADSGSPKNSGGSNSPLGDGGLQKWTYANGKWTLNYTLAAGLGLVPNTASTGVTGLLGLTGQVVGDTVQLYATSYTAGDTDRGHLYSIADPLAATTAPTGERFVTLARAPVDSTFKGVAFAPTGPAAAAVPEPTSWATTMLGLGIVGGTLRRRSRRAVAERSDPRRAG